MDTNIFFIFFVVLLGLGGFLFSLGLWSDDKKCISCKRLGPSKYMSKDTRGRYWHYSCYQSDYFFD